jgi:hypothetical protein
MPGRSSILAGTVAIVGNPSLGAIASFGASQYWTQAKIDATFLFFASDNTDILNKVAATHLPNQVTGSSDYLTVTGTGLNARYRTPDNATYRTADSDYVFWKSDASESTCDGNRLIAYDFPRILVKYLNVAPYTILWIAILKPGVTVTNGMVQAFNLPVWWSGVSNFTYGSIKGNRLAQSVWVPEATYPATLVDTAKTMGWFDFTEEATITKVGSAVSAVNDKSGNSHHFAWTNNGGTENKPTWSASGLRFTTMAADGFIHLFKTAPFTWNQPVFVYMIVKQISWVSAYFFDGNANDSVVLFGSGTGMKGYAGAASAENDDLVTGQKKIVRVLLSGATSKLQVAELTATTWSAGTNAAGGFTLGSKANGLSNFINAEYSELILRNTTDDEAALLAYLKTKYTL